MTDPGHPRSEGPGRFRLATLGTAALYRATEPPQLVLGPGKPLALLAYLHCSPRRAATREHLADLLWSDAPPSSGRHALRQTVWYLRQRLDGQLVDAHEGEVALVGPLESDRVAFLAALDRGALVRAVALYRGQFLPDFALPGGAAFEQWADVERFRLRQAFARAAEVVVRRWLSEGRFLEARQLARRVRDSDPTQESGWRLLLEALLSAGDRISAVSEADALLGLLRDEAREPEPATRELLRLSTQTGAEPGDGAGEAGRRERPSLVAELVGREAEFSTVIDAWDETRRGRGRHVHVTAPAGLGKTRLLADVHQRLRALGARVVALRARQAERRIAFGLASELATALARLPGALGVSPETARTLVGLDPSLSSVYSATADRAAGSEAVRRRTLALAQLANSVAEEGPVALLIDDLHWVDAESRQMLLALLGRVAGTRVLIVTAARPVVEGMLRADGTREIALAPLTYEQAGALIASLGTLPDDPWARDLSWRIHAATGGSPLLILESLQLSLERGSLALEEGRWRCQDPATLWRELEKGGALRHRIAHLTPEQGELLLLLAVAGAPVLETVLERAAGRSAEVLRPDLELLEKRGLATRSRRAWEPAHDEIGAIAVEVAAEADIRRAEAALGRALIEEAAGEPTVLLHAGRHLRRAGDGAGARSVFVRWAAELRRRGDRRTPQGLAAEFLETADLSSDVRGLARSLPLHVRLGRRRMAAAVAAVLVPATVTVGLVARGEATPPGDLLLAVHMHGVAGTWLATAHLPPLWWTGDRPIDAADGARQLSLGSPELKVDGVVPRPDGKAMVVTSVAPDPGGIDLYLVQEDRTVRRLTRTPGDDGEPTWSPDGTRIAFKTARWNRMAWYDLAILDLRSGAVTPLVVGDRITTNPHWSPDGTRVAYQSQDARTAMHEVCWTTIDGRTGRCHATGAALVGFLDPARVLVHETQGDSAWLAALDVERGTMDVLLAAERCALGAVVAPAGARWLAARDTCDERVQTWYVRRLDAPQLRRPVRFGSTPARAFVLVPAGASAGSYIERIAIVSLETGIFAGVSHRLAAVAVSAAGDTLVCPVLLRWEVSDTSVATVDARGVLRPRRPGRAVLRVSAGGWRADSVALRVQESSARTLMRETWNAGLEARWRPFGAPRPSLTGGPGGVPAFWNRGDGSFTSGAYSRNELPAARGIGIEVMLSTPVTAIQWQEARVVLTARIPEDAVAPWNHQTSDLQAVHPEYVHGCGFAYPGWARGEGRLHQATLLASTPSQVAIDLDLHTGSWYRVTLQLFPDGTCGLAVNGRPVARMPSDPPSNWPHRVVLEGASLGTQILHGPLEVWEGVRTGIDWSVLEPPEVRVRVVSGEW